MSSFLNGVTPFKKREVLYVLTVRCCMSLLKQLYNIFEPRQAFSRINRHDAKSLKGSIPISLFVMHRTMELCFRSNSQSTS